MLDPLHPKRQIDAFEYAYPLHGLWRELALFSVSKSTEAMHRFLAQLCEMVGAQDATWLAMKRHGPSPGKMATEHVKKVLNELNGWAPVAALYLNEGKSFKAVTERWFIHACKEGVDPLSKAMLNGQGETRAHIMNEVATKDEWDKHWFSQKFLKFFDVGNRMMAVFPINKSCESCIVIDRSTANEPFNCHHKDLLRLAISGTADLHRRMFLERGILDSSTLLSKREMDTYRMLLTERTEGEIAESMKLSIHTVHDYARQLYKKFRVKGRVGLMALVLGV